MSPSVAVFLGIGLLAILAFVRAIQGKGWPTPRQIAGLWLSGLILLFIGRASAPLAKGLTLIMVLAVVLTEGIPGLSVLTPAKTKATPSPAPPTPTK